VAYVTGDDVLDTIQKTQASGGSEFTNIYTKEKLSGWQFKPIYAQAYLGGLGISAAFANGADIVICGRTSDASTVIGSAFWWHDWKRSDLDKLANAFVAGHLLECSTYVCGGNFTGFKTLEEKGWHNIGFPIGEISKDGSVEMTKQINSGGLVSPDSCKSQLLYEIQGPQYYNSDVTAILSNISFHHVATNRVAVRGVGFAPPPPTTKVGITARGGFQAEISWFLVGLDIAAKARMLESQIRYELAPYSKNYTLLSFSQLGSSAPNPSNQNAATVTFRVLVQGREASHIDVGRFLRPVIDCIMEGYPGATFHLDYRQGIPKAIFEYYVTLLPQSLVNHEAHLPDGKTISIPPPPATKTFALQQPTLPTTKSPISLSSLGPTTTLPLGTIVHARSGDKGSDANVGFWVSKPAHYPWLRTLLSVEKIKELLGEEYTPGKSIDRFELPELWGVHFLLKEHLDRGVSCTGSVDFLGKNVAEYLRSKFVEIPTRFVNEARI
jgi:Acyclic terpene utilisation family protein AtuA